MEPTLTDSPRRRHPHEVYAHRRLIALYLPAVVLGMVAYMASYAMSFTGNGLTLFAAVWVGLWVAVAARDAEVR